MTNKILLSFDIEEFDIPNEYGASLSMQEQIEMGKKSVDVLISLLQKWNIKTTCFTTALLANEYKKGIQELAKQHEIASHSYRHTGFEIEDLKTSKQILESITNQPVIGFRSPRLREIEYKNIEEAGYKYDSSLNPTYIPSRYNKFKEPRTIHQKNNLFIIPSSVTPRMRIPIFWLSFKVFPLFILKYWSSLVFKSTGYLVLYFHPWEFCNLQEYSLPFYIKKLDSEKMISKMERYIEWLKTRGEFIHYKELIKNEH